MALITDGIGPAHQTEPIKALVANAKVIMSPRLDKRIAGYQKYTETDQWAFYTNTDGSYTAERPLDLPGISLSTDFVSDFFKVRTFLKDTGTEHYCPENTSQCWGIHREAKSWPDPKSKSVDFFLADKSIEVPDHWTIETISSSNAYHHVEASISWIRDVFPYWAPPPNLLVTPNTRMARCNAFYSRSVNEIVLLEATEGYCPNASYSSIVRHELGHAFVMTLNLSEYTSNDYWGFHEGVADALSALSLDASCSGLDFRGDDTGCYRDFSNVYQRFPVNSEDPHLRGMPLVGAFWELQVALKKRYGIAKGLKISKNLFLYTMAMNDTGYDYGIAQDLLLVDSKLYRGANSYLIVTIFKEKNLI